MEVKHVDGRFRLKENLGTCTKCSMFQAANLVDTGHTILVKIGQSKHRSLLECELAILDQLHGLPGIPGIIWSGMEFEQDGMIFEDLGSTLDNVFKSTGRRLSMNTIVFLAEHLNILVGPVLPGQQTNELCLFDFSLTQLYRDPRTYSHVPFLSGRPLSTILPFASLNHHSGNQPSRRDDLESLAYLLIYLARGSLPWIDTNVTSNNDILQSKESILVAQLCDTLPSPFASFLSYVCDLSFTQKPDYNYVLNLFRALHVDTAAPPPVLSPAVEMSERAYWMEDAVSLHPKLAVSVYKTPWKRRRDTTVAPPTSIKRRGARDCRH
ncbi:kinase-like protein [Paxillus ammoniavirescens]|nr:kinase-like protein [Paxillus ammoniavirescens]